MKRVIACTVMFLAAANGFLAEGSDKQTAGTAVYEQFPKAIRPLLKTAYATEVKRQTKIVADAKVGISKAKGEGEKERAKEKFETAKQMLESLKANDPPFVGIQRNCTRTDNGFTRLSWQIGDIGIDTEPDGLTVQQVIDQTTAILHQSIDGGGEQLIYLEGVSTAGWVNGDTYPITTPIWVSGTTTYKTAAGGSNTVLKAEKFNWSHYRESSSKGPK